MKVIRGCIVGLAVGLTYLPPLDAADPSFQGVGALDPENFLSDARGVSGDGSVVVGFSSVGPGQDVEAFRWTAAGGMQTLGDLPGGDNYCFAREIKE